ncbi:NIPSNAP family protein [Pararhodonellum marinum]|uniref:NIPSNAP family protein n=1 Tax=Pararhodonellum marinum TaxID=2755358 RepID=UPI00189040FE|nr:NIPSNAP family protein [Pararhodonellum marinum]
MKINILILTSLILGTQAMAQKPEMEYFEMRTYHAHEGKRPDLIKRFEDHTLKLFSKNGIGNLAYFIPTDPNDQTLTFILAYPDQDSRDLLWNQFANDPEWQAAYKASEANGPLVAKVDQVFMTMAEDLNEVNPEWNPKKKKIFELRTYTLYPGKLDDIHRRFRDHTQTLFEKQGMENVVYWYTVESSGNQPKLVYLLAHKNEKKAKSSFEKFRNDPDWIAARDASELNGPIVEKVESKYLKALPFSPLQ